MNENLNLVKILKDCPRGTKLYSPIYGEVELGGVYNGARVYGKANIYGRAKVFDGAKVYNHVKVFGESEVRGGAELYGNAEISNTSDYIVFKNWWSNGRYFTWTRSNNMWAVGSFYGSGQELITKAYEESELSGKEYERVVKYVESILNEK